MITHWIYHVRGKKVGCTNNLERRQLEYGRQGIAIQLEVLEELYDKTDQEAGDIEWSWADKFGYQRGNHYTVAKTGFTSPGAYATLTFEQRSAAGQKGGKIGGPIGGKASGAKKSEAARVRQSKIPPETRSSIASEAALAAARLGVSGFKKKAICPHCAFEGNYVPMQRWHYDNCPKKVGV